MIYRTNAYALLAAVVLAFAAGCAKTPKAENEVATESINGVLDQLNASQGEVDKVIAAIDQLQQPGDMKTAFANYTASVESIRKAGERVRDRREAMQAKRDEYIARWQKDLETIQNPEVKAALAERKARVAENYDRIKVEAETVRNDYTPFLANLEEIRKALSLDLTTAGVTALKKPLDQARVDGDKLKASVAKLRGELEKIVGAMAPATAPATLPATKATAPAK